MSDVVLAERDGAVGIARLNRPEARNALSAELLADLIALVEAWDADPEVRCIVIAGGDDYFAAGADIKAMRDRSFQEALAHPALSFWVRMAACPHHSWRRSRATPWAEAVSWPCCAT